MLLALGEGEGQARTQHRCEVDEGEWGWGWTRRWVQFMIVTMLMLHPQCRSCIPVGKSENEGARGSK